MARINVSCPSPTCGDVMLTQRDVTLRVCLTDNQGSYCFRCPKCRLRTSKPAERKIVQMLIDCGVRMQVWRLPSDLREEHAGESINYDDTIEFHYAIEALGGIDLASEFGIKIDD